MAPTLASISSADATRTESTGLFSVAEQAYLRMQSNLVDKLHVLLRLRTRKPLARQSATRNASASLVGEGIAFNSLVEKLILDDLAEQKRLKMSTNE
jgi:hypothetical protein